MSGEMMRVKGEPGDIAKLAAKLVEARKVCGYVQKKGFIEVGKGYNVALAEHVFEKVREALDTLGVATLVEEQEASQAEVERGTPPKRYMLATTTLRLVFIDTETGATISTTGRGSGMDSSDKGPMKARTAALKYCLAGAFLISWGDDPEADLKVQRAAEGQAPLAETTAAPAAAEAPKGRNGGRAKSEAKVLVEEIGKATDAAALEALKPRVLALQATDRKGYEAAVPAYRAKAAELTKPAAPAEGAAA